MLESGVEDEHIALINNQMEFGSTIGMVPSLIPFSKWTFLPIPWLQNLQAGRERLKEVRAPSQVLSSEKAKRVVVSSRGLESSVVRRNKATAKISSVD